MNRRKTIAFIGAGPACLTSAYQLAKTQNFDILIFEQDPDFLGGLSKTISYDGYLFDVGGHRFFSKSQTIRKMWEEILPDDMIIRDRKSRIYYNGNFFHYPLRPWEALRSLGPVEAVFCVLSYLKVKLFPISNIKSFEQWVSNQFGKRLFNIFFKTYTEKVWGMKCDEISSDWAAQRIKNLSLSKAVFSSIFKGSGYNVQSLIEKFHYPRKGPGMMWDSCGEKIKKLGGYIHQGHRVTGLKKVTNDGWILTTKTEENCEEFRADIVVSSTDLSMLVRSINPSVPTHIQNAGKNLKYRDFLMVALVVEDDGTIFDDQWLYIHGPEVKVGRIQNFKSWSPEMVPCPSETCLGMEYFCFEGDDLWKMSEKDVSELAKKELALLGLVEANKVKKVKVVKQRKAYPVYDDAYQEHLKTIKEFINTNYDDLYTIGRNGMHQYNNQDHAMMTGMLVASNIIEGSKKYNHWQVNQQAEYLENNDEAEDTSLRMVPQPRPNN